MTFSDGFCIFLGQENGNIRIYAPCIVVLWHRDHVTLTSCARNRARELAKSTSRGYWAVQKCQFVSPFNIHSSCLCLPSIIRCVRLDRTTAVGVVVAMRPAILHASDDTLCGWYWKYPDTVPLTKQELILLSRVTYCTCRQIILC